MFKIKYDENELIEKYKTCLIAQEFLQQEGIDYEKTFALTVQKESLRLYLTIVAAINLELHQMDIVTAYLISNLEAEGQEIYIRISEGVDIQQECTEFI